MAVNKQTRNALKRLKADLEELNSNPVANVSATPLDDNMFEWHCNFRQDGQIYHLILFYPEDYPYVSPSAEFLPPGFRFQGGATMAGKKGVKVCLSIFSDYANIHKEWKNEKGMGWTPGYTTQTVLLNLVSFLSENQGSNTEFNSELSRKFTCSDCGHTNNEPFPPVLDVDDLGSVMGAAGGAVAMETDEPQIMCYISKNRYVSPKTEDDLFGFGLVVSGPKYRLELSSPCEFLSAGGFYGMKKAVKIVQSILKEELKLFLPMFINQKHGKMIQKSFEKAMRDAAEKMPWSKNVGDDINEIILRILPNLMSTTVVAFSKGTTHTSDNHLNGYFLFHRLFLWAIRTFPGLGAKVEETLQRFLEREENRRKEECPNLGQWLMLLSASEKFKWTDVSAQYLQESWRRNVMWYVKNNAELGYLDTPRDYRMQHTLTETEVSRKLLAFQVAFLDIAMPPKMALDDVMKRYDDHNGCPTPEMAVQLKESVKRIKEMASFDDWFKLLHLPMPAAVDFENILLESVEFAINTQGYHWSHRNGGGWDKVFKKYKDGTPNWVKRGEADAPKTDEEAATNMN